MALLGLTAVLLGAVGLFWLPGLVLARAMGVQSGPRRGLSALWLGPVGVGLWTVLWSPAPSAPWLPATSGAVLILLLGRRGLGEAWRGRWGAGGPPLPLLAAVALYGWLRPDSLAFQTLGVLGPAVEAAGYPLGLGRALPGTLLGHALPGPVGQVGVAAAALSVFGQPGVRLEFAGVLTLLAGATFDLGRRWGLSRRGAGVAAALAVWNPMTMEANHLDALATILPAAGLALALGVRRGERRGAWLVSLVAVRPLFLLSGLVLGLRRRRWLLIPAAALALGALPRLGGDRFQLEPGLLPLSSWPGAWPWLSPLSRVPYAAAPAWVLLPLGVLGALGSGLVGLALLGLPSLGRLPEEARGWGRGLILPIAAALLATNLLLRGEDFARGALLLPPLLVVAVLGAGRARRRPALLAGALLLTALGPVVARSLLSIPWPVQPTAYGVFPHLRPEPPTWLAQERARAGAVAPWPRYSVEQIIDPWFIGEGKRWRDAADELRHPSLRYRYPSIDETILGFTRAEAFTRRWLPDHPRLRPRGQERGPGDPYLEQAGLLVSVDLADALRGGPLSLRCRPDDGGAVDLDLLDGDGPWAVEVAPEGLEPVVVAAFKEFYGPTTVEAALVTSPAGWVQGPDPRALTLPHGVLRVRVPGRAFFSFAQILGERVDTMGLLVGQVSHADLRCGEGVAVFGPYRE